jgi:anti-sigma-K factor RskA
VTLWRSVSAAAAALAAALALFIVLDGRWPGLEREQNYVAVVNRGGDMPALIVRIDLRQGVVRVRSVTAEAPPGRSLELWYIGASQAAPKSLGILTRTPRPIAIPAALREGGAEGASIAVSVEPVGGSPTGEVTGPVIYSGKLIKEQP